MEQMYPHPIDRYRIAKVLLDDLIEIRGENVKSMAMTAGVARTTIYALKINLQNLEDYKKGCALKGPQPTSRHTLLQTLDALKANREQFEVLLWLLLWKRGAGPMLPGEVRHYAPGSDGKFLATLNASHLRSEALRLLKQVLARQVHSPSREEPRARMLLELMEPDQLMRAAEVLDLEKRPGQRLIVTKYPSYLTSPEQVVRNNKLFRPQVTSLAGTREYHKIAMQRREIFVEHLRLYGERSIHSKEGLRKYVNEDFKHHLNVRDRKAHVKNLIRLLSDNPRHFQVALTDAEVDMEIEIKSTIGAVIRGAPGDTRLLQERIVCGPRYIYSYDPVSVLSFLLDFEREWDQTWNEAPAPEANNQQVIKWLECLLRKANQK